MGSEIKKIMEEVNKMGSEIKKIMEEANKMGSEIKKIIEAMESEIKKIRDMADTALLSGRYTETQQDILARLAIACDNKLRSLTNIITRINNFVVNMDVDLRVSLDVSDIDLCVGGNIKARDINARNITAKNITAVTNLGSLPRKFDGVKWWWEINIGGETNICIEMTGINEELTKRNSVAISVKDRGENA